MEFLAKTSRRVVCSNTCSQRRWTLREEYGLTSTQFDALLASQGGGCAVCKTPDPGGRGTWHIDHDHTCCPGKRSCGACIRGILCSGCNIGLGHFGDDADRLMQAAAYLLSTRDVLGNVATGLPA